MDRPVATVLLLIGIAVVVLNAFLLVAFYGPGGDGPGPMFVSPPDAFAIGVVPILAFAGSLFGLWRMWVARRGSR